MDPSLGRIFAALASKASGPSDTSEELVAIGQAMVARLRDIFLGNSRPDDYDDLLERVESGDEGAVPILADVIDGADPSPFLATLVPLAADASRAGFVPPPPANADTQYPVAELEQAVAQQRELFAAEPTNRGHAIELDMLLSDLPIRYRDLGRHEEALVAAQAYREFRQELAEIDPDSQMDISFDLLSDAYAKLDRFEEAAAVKEEGLEHRRDAWSLMDLSGYYTSLSRTDEAVAMAEEAVAMERKRENADPHQSLLSILLEHLSATYRSVGRKEDALFAIEQAVAIHRNIAAGQPVTGCELGRTLTNLLTLHDELDHLEVSAADCDEAKAATENCLALHRVMASTDVEGLADLLAQRETLARLSQPD